MKLTGRGFNEPRNSFESSSDGQSVITSDGRRLPLKSYDLGDYILSACSLDLETVFPETVIPITDKKSILSFKA